MTDKLYHYSIQLVTPQSPTKKLQKAFDEQMVYLDKDLKASTYGRHLMIPTGDMARQIIEAIAPLITKRYGAEAWMTYAYGGVINDSNTAEKFESHKKIAEEISITDYNAESGQQKAVDGHEENDDVVEAPPAE